MDSNRAPGCRESAERTAAQYLARRDVGPWTQSDEASLRTWLAESVSHRVAYYRLNASWDELGRLQALGAGRGFSPEQKDDLAPLDGIAERADGVEMAKCEPTRRWRVRLTALAASIGLVMVGVSAWYAASGQRNRYSTPVGATESLPLADGSRILLNTNSAVRVAFSPRERRIELDRGEAYFEVAHDAGRPFVVQVGGERVIAVGTQFAVRQEGKLVRVSVTGGTVRLDTGDAGFTTPTQRDASGAPESAHSAEVLLPAGSIARVDSQSVSVQKRPVAEVEQSLSWRTGSLTFRDTPLADAVAEFNRYNTRKIVLKDASIAQLQVGGIFRATNIDPFVHLLEQGLPVQATVVDDRILLSARP